MKAGDVGLRDAVASGWFNWKTSEVAPGFPIAADDIVVDIGGGAGGMAKFCARLASQVILLDHDAELLAEAVKSASSEAVAKVTGEVGDAAALPFPDGLATKVICTEVLEHVDDPPAAMAELVRVGAPGALYLLSVPGAASERLQGGFVGSWYTEKPHHIRIFEDGELEQLVERSGLVIEGRGAHGFFWSLWWLFSWQFGLKPDQSHPLLDAWTETWSHLLDRPGGASLRQDLNALAPKSCFVVARKP